MKDHDSRSYFPSSDDSDGSDGRDGSEGSADEAAAGAAVLDTTCGAGVALTIRGGTRIRLTSTGAQPFMPQTFLASA